MTTIDTIELTKKLVTISSVSGGEKEILDFIEGWLENHAFDFVVKKENFVAGRVNGTIRDQAIILSGHIDTVSAGNPANWETSPSTCVEKDGKLFGLGVTDMKAGSAAHLAVAASLVGQSLQRDLWVVSTACEELNGQGTADFVDWFKENTHYSSAIANIAEPTELKEIRIGQRGSRFIRAVFQGRSGHGSRQENFQLSALYAAQKFMAENEKIVASLSQYKNSMLSAPTLVPTSLQAGSSSTPNKTADLAELIFDLRTTPEFDATGDEEIDALAKNYNFKWEYVVSPVNATLADGNEPFIKVLQEIAHIKNLSVSVGSNDSGFYQEAGIPCVVFGPGELTQSHQANEFAKIENIECFVSLMLAFIQEVDRS